MLVFFYVGAVSNSINDFNFFLSWKVDKVAVMVPQQREVQGLAKKETFPIYIHIFLMTVSFILTTEKVLEA